MKKILSVIAVTALFGVLLLCNSARWLLSTFGELDFSIVLYQLNSHLKGTGREILYDYINRALIMSIVELAIAIVLWYIVIIIIKHIKAPDTNVRLMKRLRIFVILSVVLICIIELRRYAILVGIPEYISKINSASTLFEDEFVEPDSVDIRFPENRKNLVYIYMESMETTYASTEVGGAKLVNYIPNLTKLSEDNISFSNDNDFGGIISFSGTGWTMAALVASTTGAPYKIPIDGNSAGEYEQILPGITSLGDILEEAGYHNYFMCGSDAEFGGRKDYFEQHGNYQIYDYYTAIEDGVIQEGYYEFWGIEDKKLYQYAKDKLSEISSNDEAFNFTMLTVDTHHPNGYICSDCDVDEYEEQLATAIVCADNQIKEFVEWIQSQSWYENTVVVIVGDHDSMNNNFWDDISEDYKRTTYNCFINVNKDLNNVALYNRCIYSMDLFPTTLSALNVEIEGNRLGLGTDVFSGKETLAERMGMETFESEANRYSEYYVKHFINGH